MAKDDLVKFSGVVVDTLPGAKFKVELDNGHSILGFISGKLRKNNIKILLGDEVDIEVSPYDISQGRIIYRR